jgi:hypothetical protein
MKRKRPAGRTARPNNPAAQPASSARPERPAAMPAYEPSAASQPASAVPRQPSLERLRRIERRKARNRAFALSIFVLAIMLVTVLLIIAVMRQAKPKPRLLFIQDGEVVHTVESTGLIIRSENVYNAPAAGLLRPLAAEGSRVAKGQKVAVIIPADKENDLKALEKCEKDIVDLQGELMSSGKGTGAQAIFDESAASLAAVVNLVRGDVAAGDLSNLSAYAASLGVILEQRTSRLSKIDFNDARLDALKQTKATLEASLGLAAGTLYCQKPGIVSFRLDGLETVLAQDAAKTMSAEDIRKYIAAAASQSYENKKVTADQPVMRISASLDQCLLFLLPNTDANLFAVDHFTDIEIPADGLTIANCRIIRSEVAGSAALLVVKTDRKVEWLADRRTIPARLTLSRTSGMKVPLSALVGYDAKTGTASIELVIGGYTQACPVSVVDQDSESAIIAGVEGEKTQPQVSAIVIANPESIEAGEFIDN